MAYKPKKVFIKEKDGYVEITYEEFCRKENSEFKDKLFISLYGTLMEVEEDYYKQFYREKRREKYMQERSAAKGYVHYNALDTDDFNGEDILISAEADVCEQVTDKLMAEYIRNLTSLLPSEEKKLIEALFFEGKTEREYAKEKGIYHNAVHKKKIRILEKLKKILEN